MRDRVLLTLVAGGLYGLFFLGASYPLGDGDSVVFGRANEVAYLQQRSRPWFRDCQEIAPRPRCDPALLPAARLLQALSETLSSLPASAAMQSAQERLRRAMRSEDSVLELFDASLRPEQRAIVRAQSRPHIALSSTATRLRGACDAGALPLLIADLQESLRQRLQRAPELDLPPPASVSEGDVHDGRSLLQVVHSLLLSPAGQPSRAQLQRWIGLMDQFLACLEEEMAAKRQLLDQMPPSARRRVFPATGSPAREGPPAGGGVFREPAPRPTHVP